MRIGVISPENFNNYITNINYGDYFQTNEYKIFAEKNKLKTKLIGFFEGDALKGVCLILYKRIFFGYANGFAPRGLITDYSDIDTLNKILSMFNKYLDYDKYMTFKLDPPLIVFKRNKKGKVTDKFEHSKSVLNIFKKHGFTHSGFNKYFENTNPRFETLLEINTSKDILFNKLRKQLRNKLRKSIKYGLTIYKDNKYNFDNFKNILNNTDKPIAWYKNFYYAFKENLEIYYAKLNTVDYVENSRKLYENELEKNDYLTSIIQTNGYKGKNMTLILNQKMQSDKILAAYKSYMVEATELLKNNPDGLIVGVSIILKFKDTLYLIKESYDKKYKNLCSNYLIKWKVIEKYSDNPKINYFNLGAISGEFDADKNQYRGLNEMKLSYNSKVIEYMGEFSKIVAPNIYKMYMTFGKK